MNTARLKELIEVLHCANQAHFDMDYWINPPDPNLPISHIKNIEDLHHACGTTACAMGYAALHPPFRMKGLGINYMTHNLVFQGHTNMSAAARFFDLSRADAMYLFDPGEYEPHQTTPRDVIDRINELLERPE